MNHPQRQSEVATSLHEILYAHVSMPFGERVLLGTIVNIYEEKHETRARVKHFNGERWPVEPNVEALTILGSFLS